MKHFDDTLALKFTSYRVQVSSNNRITFMRIVHKAFFFNINYTTLKSDPSRSINIIGETHKRFLSVLYTIRISILYFYLFFFILNPFSIEVKKVIFYICQRLIKNKYRTHYLFESKFLKSKKNIDVYHLFLVSWRCCR